MSDQQDALVKVYQDKWPSVAMRLAADTKLSWPHLINLNINNYPGAATRLMVVGQQTGGWGEEQCWDRRPADVVETVKNLVGLYNGFDLGAKYRRTPFFKASYELCRLLNGDRCERQFLWANLVKIDEARQRPSKDTEDFMAAHFNVLPTEVKLAAPKVVVFLTGPHYDPRLASTFPGCEFVEVSGRTTRELSLLKHPGLPPHSYRTYHPNYLIRSKARWNIISEIAGLVKDGQ